MTTLQSVTKTVLSDAVKAAGTVLVVLGLVPVIAQAAGAAHIVVPAAVTTYATIATAIVTGFLAWAKQHGVTPASVVSAVAHRGR